MEIWMGNPLPVFTILRLCRAGCTPRPVFFLTPRNEKHVRRWNFFQPSDSVGKINFQRRQISPELRIKAAKTVRKFYYLVTPHNTVLPACAALRSLSQGLKRRIMTSKPKSGRGIYLSVAHCSHPDLDSTDKALLMYLALNADYATGQNARPGNPALCDALKLGRSAVNDRLTKNIERGLIQRTHEAHGRKQASVFRICVEHPAFPDQVPTSGEWLVEEKTSGSSRTVVEKEMSGLERTFSKENVRPAADKCPAQDQKTSGDRAENVRQLAEHTNTAPPTHPLPTQTSAQETSGNLPGWVGSLFFDENQTALNLRKADRDGFMAAIRQHGEVIIAAAWREYVKAGPYNSETRFPAYLFLQDGNMEAYIQSASRKLKLKQQRNDPEYAARNEAYIQQQKQAETEFWNKRPPEENGGDPLEYLRQAGEANSLGVTLP